jgi:hypothetical protein
MAEVMSCFIFGELDVFGGLDLHAASLYAAAAGGLFALPLLACSAAGRLPAAKRRFPVLDQLHEQQAALVGHFTAGGACARASEQHGAGCRPCLLPCC